MIPLPVPPEAVRVRPTMVGVRTFGPPRGVSDDDCGTVEVLLEHVPGVVMPDRLHVPVRLDEDDLAMIAVGHPVWLTICASGLPPFLISAGPAPAHVETGPAAGPASG